MSALHPPASVPPQGMSQLLIRLSPLALVAANLVPLFGVLLGGWTVASVVIFFWAENLVIGFYTLLKLLAKGPQAWFMALFFLLHYGGFCAGHGFFLIALLDLGEPDLLGETSWPFIFVFVELLWNVVRYLLDIVPGVWLWGLAALFVSHGISLIGNYIMNGEHANTTVSNLMTAPYKRIVVLHVAILLGAMAVEAAGSPMVLLLLLVILKIVMDLRAHLKAHGQSLRDWLPGINPA